MAYNGLTGGIFPGQNYTPPPPPTTPPPGPGAYTEGTVPQDLLDKNSANLRDALAGNLPQDVIDRIRNSAASFGVMNGLAGSDFSGYRGLTHLGLTSLGRQDEAMKMLAGLYTSPLQAQQLQLQKDREAFEKQQYYTNLNKDKTKTGGVYYPPPGGGGGGPGPGAGPGGPGRSPTNYGPDISNFINRYLPGAGGGSPGPITGGGSPFAGIPRNNANATFGNYYNEDTPDADYLRSLGQWDEPPPPDYGTSDWVNNMYNDFENPTPDYGSAEWVNSLYE